MGTLGFTLVFQLSCFRLARRTTHHPHDDLEGGYEPRGIPSSITIDCERSEIFSRIVAWILTFFLLLLLLRVSLLSVCGISMCDVCACYARAKFGCKWISAVLTSFYLGSGFGCRHPDRLVPSFDSVVVIVTICYLNKSWGRFLVSRLPSEVSCVTRVRPSFANRKSIHGIGRVA